MTVADRLGPGSSFSGTGRRSARGRAKAVAQGDVPAYELVRIPLQEVVPTPLNPRRNFGTDEEKTALGESLSRAQLAACVAVTRSAYLALWPEQETEIGEAEFVLVNGERRYRSALHVGLEALDFVVRDELAGSREDFVDNLLKENLDREDFDVIERARGVEQLVEVCGERSEAARRLKRDRSWVTNQIALLRLPAEIQAMLSSGDMPERDGRHLSRQLKENPQLTAADLVRLWKDHREDQAEQREQQKQLLRAAKNSSVLSADNSTSPDQIPEGESHPAEVLSADNTSAPGEGSGGEENQVQVLSADNTHRSAEEPAATAAVNGSGAAEPASSGMEGSPVLLSADNTSSSSEGSGGGGRQAQVVSADTTSSPASVPGLSAAAVVEQLLQIAEHDPGNVADMLAQNLPKDMLNEMITALREWV